MVRVSLSTKGESPRAQEALRDALADSVRHREESEGPAVIDDYWTEPEEEPAPDGD